ncbi:hypothetical protein ONZ45_g1058 [Pleurotus djamor]|nr:hypothetical protein ONZ45_g1058 [Pleurotus djamor]
MNVGLLPRHSGSCFRAALRPKRTSLLRYNSTTTSPGGSPQQLNWEDFLKIRGGRRKWQTAATVPFALLGFFGGIAYFGNLEPDPTKPIMGVDPFFFYGFCTLGCVGAGALIGPTVGSALWRYTHRNLVTVIDAREKEFLQHIARRRVDPSLQSPTTPIPDFYGEKIGSLHQYRQWLRDQGKYRRKAVLPED